MSSRPRPVLVAHADWSTNPKKRWIAIGSLSGTSYCLSAPQRVGDVASLLCRLNERADGGTLVVGFDFPIGLPSTLAKCAHVTRFLDILPLLGSGNWASFYNVAVNPTDISFSRPFYPYRPGGALHVHLTSARGVSSIRDLLRLCERGNVSRDDACALFWTLGAKQVGRAAIIGWRDMLAPALSDSSLDVAVWPFAGSLTELLQNRHCIIVETYPAEACLHLGMTPPGRGWSKRNQNDRKAQAHHFFNWATSRGILMEDILKDEIRTGFAAGEDPFDAVIGLMSMIEVLLGYRSDGAPSSAPIRDIEGWIFGQT